MRLLAGWVVVLALVACHSKPAPAPPVVSNAPLPERAPREPAPPTPAGAMSKAQFERTMGTMVTMLDRLAAEIDLAGTDCGKMAAGFERVMNANVSFFAAAKRLKNSPGVEQQAQDWMVANMQRIQPSLTKFSNAASTCGGDPAFSAAVQRMSELSQ